MLKTIQPPSISWATTGFIGMTQYWVESSHPHYLGLLPYLLELLFVEENLTTSNLLGLCLIQIIPLFSSSLSMCSNMLLGINLITKRTTNCLCNQLLSGTQMSLLMCRVVCCIVKSFTLRAHVYFGWRCVFSVWAQVHEAKVTTCIYICVCI